MRSRMNRPINLGLRRTSSRLRYFPADTLSPPFFVGLVGERGRGIYDLGRVQQCHCHRYAHKEGVDQKENAEGRKIVASEMQAHNAQQHRYRLHENEMEKLRDCQHEVGLRLALLGYGLPRLG